MTTPSPSRELRKRHSTWNSSSSYVSCQWWSWYGWHWHMFRWTFIWLLFSRNYFFEFQFLLGELLGLSEFLSLATERERTSAAKVGLFKVSWRSARDIYSDYWASSLLNVLVNELLKTLVAEPRPHFLDTCKPNWESIDCTHNKGYEKLPTNHLITQPIVDRFILTGSSSFPHLYAPHKMLPKR